MPSFRCRIGFTEGARRTLDDARRRGAWKDAAGDGEYQALVDQAIAAGAVELDPGALAAEARPLG